MTLPVSPSGETQLWSSVNDWLAVNVPAAGGGFTYAFDQNFDPAVYPRVEVSQFNFSEPGDTALGGVIFTNNPTGRIQGKAQRAMLEINIRTDGGPTGTPDALQKCRLLKDAFDRALCNAGMFSEADNALLYPPIIVYDANGATTNTFARVRTEDDNCVVKNFYKPDPTEGLIFRYQLLFKLEWYELL